MQRQAVYCFALATTSYLHGPQGQLQVSAYSFLGSFLGMPIALQMFIAILDPQGYVRSSKALVTSYS